MRLEFNYDDGRATVSYDETPELRVKLWDRVLEFYKKHEAFSGEHIMQSDNPQIEAPELLSEIADDIFNFETKWKGNK